MKLLRIYDLLLHIFSSDTGTFIWNGCSGSVERTTRRKMCNVLKYSCHLKKYICLALMLTFSNKSTELVLWWNQWRPSSLVNKFSVDEILSVTPICWRGRSLSGTSAPTMLFRVEIISSTFCTCLGSVLVQTAK